MTSVAWLPSYLGSFNTNYIIFLNPEIFKFYFSQRKHENFLEYLRLFFFLHGTFQNYLFIYLFSYLFIYVADMCWSCPLYYCIRVCIKPQQGIRLIIYVNINSWRFNFQRPAENWFSNTQPLSALNFKDPESAVINIKKRVPSRLSENVE